ncbi:MAG: hypothetical protein ACTHLW_19015 [Verrucomicrobiota bacterium]
MRIGIEHRDADDLGGKGPEVELLQQFGTAEAAGGFVGNFLSVAEQVFLLRFIEVLKGEGGSFYIEDQFGHESWRTTRMKNPSEVPRFSIPVLNEGYFFFLTTTFFFAAFFLAAAMCLTPDQLFLGLAE